METTSSADSTRAETEKLGLRLKEIREYLNYSQQLVSHRTGIPRSAISDIERGVRKVDSLELKKMAKLYQYPVGYFLDEEVDADAADHAIAALARRLTKLNARDRDQVMQFAEFLRAQKQANKEADDDSAPSAVEE